MANGKDHRYVRPRKKRDQCQARGHDQAWGELSGSHNIVCFDCRSCFSCSGATCPARRRPGHPEEKPSPVAAGEESAARQEPADPGGSGAETGAAPPAHQEVA